MSEQFLLGYGRPHASFAAVISMPVSLHLVHHRAKPSLRLEQRCSLTGRITVGPNSPDDSYSLVTFGNRQMHTTSYQLALASS